MIYAFGDYELDTRVYELRHAGNPRPVEPQVFDVLAYLVRNRDRVVSKEELLEKLWPDRFVSEATLTSRLKEARKAIGDTGKAQNTIRTHHGRGYRFVAAVEERGAAAPSIGPSVSGDFVVAPTAVETTREFVGRGAELSQMRAAFGRAMNGQRQIVFVEGEAGAGKTALVEAFLGSVSGSVLIARGQCVEYRGSGEPYMPLLDALNRLSAEPAASHLPALLKRDAPTWLLQMPSLVSEEDLPALRTRTGTSGDRMLREFGMAMERFSAETPLVLLLEDLHWSDYATLDAIDLLARQHHPGRLLVVGTYRPADVRAARHPVYAMAQELRARGGCEIIALPTLQPGEVETMLQIHFGGAAFVPELSRVLHARTSGNPLFLRNLVDSWTARGMIVFADGRWSLRSDPETLETDVPDTLQNLIEKQIADLSDDRQRMLEAASLIGRQFPVSLLADSLPRAHEDVEHDCETLAKEGRFIRGAGTEQWGDGRLTALFAFIHDLYVDVFSERVPSARRSRTHQQIGQALESAWSGRERERAAELALHFEQAVDRLRGPRYLQLAAEQALQRSAYREAVTHLTSALRLIEGLPPSPERDRMELGIRCRLAPSLVATRGWADSAAEENYRRSNEQARTLGESELLLQTLYGMASMYEYRGEYGIAEEMARERIALDCDRTALHAVESHELMACSMLHQGRYAEALEHGRCALTAAGAGSIDPGKVVLLVQVHGWNSAALFFTGKLDDAVEKGKEAIHLARVHGDELARTSAFLQASFIRFYRREAEECRSLAISGGAIAREHRFPFHVACGRILEGWCHSTVGDHESAEREIRSGLRTCRAIGARMDIPLFLAMLAQTLQGQGNTEAAIESIEEALEVVDRNRSFFYVPEIHRMKGELLLAANAARDEVEKCFRDALRLAEEQESPILALRAAVSLARLRRDAEAVQRVRAIYSRFEQGEGTSDLREAREITELTVA
jgi:DNA-binding winged helix-turn-helix (wHTH) protein/tetratricopeptide (TPR) repeat protein